MDRCTEREPGPKTVEGVPRAERKEWHSLGRTYVNPGACPAHHSPAPAQSHQEFRGLSDFAEIEAWDLLPSMGGGQCFAQSPWAEQHQTHETLPKHGVQGQPPVCGSGRTAGAAPEAQPAAGSG